MRELLEAGVHFGHQTRRWNPKMRRFIFGERGGIYIIDLTQTQELLEEAHDFARNLSERGGTMLFVGTKKQSQDAVSEHAARVGMPYVANRWLGGLGAAAKHKLDNILERLNLSGLGKRHIRELSGGQQQAVFIGRALVGDPELILLDEPASGLDIRSRDDVIHFLHEINHQGVAIVLTSHDLNWVAAHLPWAVCLNHRVIAEGRPNEVFNPQVLKETYSGELVVIHQDGMVMIGERPHARHT